MLNIYSALLSNSPPLCPSLALQPWLLSHNLQLHHMFLQSGGAAATVSVHGRPGKKMSMPHLPTSMRTWRIRWPKASINATAFGAASGSKAPCCQGKSGGFTAACGGCRCGRTCATIVGLWGGGHASGSAWWAVHEVWPFFEANTWIYVYTYIYVCIYILAHTTHI